MKIIMLKEIFIISISVLILHILALKFFLYWTTSWYDIGMHFLGGFLIGLVVISFIRRIHPGEQILEKGLLFSSVILAVLVIGLTWELWEIFMGFTDVIADKTDTFIDLIMDFVGGSSAVLYYYFKYLE